MEPFHHDTELRDENALRLLIENKFRTALENRKQKPVDKPRVIREISIEQKSSPDSTNSVSSVYKPLQARVHRVFCKYRQEGRTAEFFKHEIFLPNIPYVTYGIFNYVDYDGKNCFSINLRFHFQYCLQKLE